LQIRAETFNLVKMAAIDRSDDEIDEGMEIEEGGEGKNPLC
jgi:hypothetical protein